MRQYKKKVLVIGYAGYIGSVLTKMLLDNNFSVTAVDNFIYKNHDVSHLEKYFDFYGYKGYARSNKVFRYLKWADYIIPLAALVGAKKCDSDPSEAYSINQYLIKEISEKCSVHQTIIYPNTNSMYGTSSSIVDENSPANPLSFYAKTKHEAEKYVLDSPNSYSFRLATVFGASPRMRLDLLVNDMFHQCYLVSKGVQQKIKLFEPHFMRNYVHVIDVARAFLHAIDRKAVPGCYNLGNPQLNCSKEQLLKQISALFNLNFADIVEISQEKDPDKRNYIVSNDKLIKTGFTFNYDLSSAYESIVKMFENSTLEERKSWRNA